MIKHCDCTLISPVNNLCSIQFPETILTLFSLGFLRVARLPGLFEGGSALGEGGGLKVPAAYNSKTINDNEVKFGGVVKDH